MDHSRGIVIGIYSLDRIADYRFAQITFHITAANAFVYRIFQISAGNMHILSQLYKYYSHSRILADGDLILTGYLKILLQLA